MTHQQKVYTQQMKEIDENNNNTTEEIRRKK